MKTLWIVTTLAVTIVGCASLNRTLPTAEELSGQGDAVALERGRTQVVQQCIACHRMYWPEEYPPAAWAEIIPDMGARAGLSESQTRDVARYMVTASRYVRIQQASSSVTE